MSTFTQPAEVSDTAESLPGWKQEIRGRLAAHRTKGAGRGASAGEQPALPGMEAPEGTSGAAARVAARVAERYAKAPTYSEMIAAEAAKAARAAEAAAEAARQAQEAAQAVTDVLWAGADSGLDMERGEPQREMADEVAPPAVQYRVHPASLPAARTREASSAAPQRDSVDPHPHVVDPFEEALVAPAQPLPARLLEFPRELVAARKARPRFAEGPLREPGAEPDKAQLRIFEVEPETISHDPVVAALASNEMALPGWSTIRLDAAPRTMEAEMATSSTANRPARGASSRVESHAAPLSSRAGRGVRGHGAGASLLADVPHVAPMGDRLLAAAVDCALVVCAFGMFVAVFVACTVHPPAGKPALVAAGAALVGFIALYQWLFFTFAESTPGMRCAKIALCTFEDENPGRKTLQHRVGALFLAALPLGLGFLWALLDDDRLGWHDRMTRTYQRSYR